MYINYPYTEFDFGFFLLILFVAFRIRRWNFKIREQFRYKLLPCSLEPRNQNQSSAFIPIIHCIYINFPLNLYVWMHFTLWCSKRLNLLHLFLHLHVWMHFINWVCVYMHFITWICDSICMKCTSSSVYVCEMHFLMCICDWLYMKCASSSVHVCEMHFLMWICDCVYMKWWSDEVNFIYIQSHTKLQSTSSLHSELGFGNNLIFRRLFSCARVYVFLHVCPCVCVCLYGSVSARLCVFVCVCLCVCLSVSKPVSVFA